MSISKALLCVSAGLILAVFVIGLLPFLVIFSWTENLGMSELYTSPLVFLGLLYREKKDAAGNRQPGRL